MYFIEQQNKNIKAEMLIKFFLIVLEANKSIKSPNSPAIRFKEQELLFKRELEEQINYRKQYNNNTLSRYLNN